MCGIAGYYSSKRYPDDVITRQLEALEHRGPDDQSVFISKGKYTGGMRRLSINDLATGNQPLYNEDKTIALLYNGEIYNYKDIRKKLEAKGHKFTSHSDGEVICHLYEEVGLDVFKELDGMFAAALWDDGAKRLILARDLPGEKPLYYSMLPDGGLVFSSEIKSLRTFPGVDLSLDMQAIWDLPSFLWIPEPNTIYKEVKALMPGHILTIDEKGMEIRSYPNNFEKHLGLEARSEKEIILEVRRIVEEAVVSRLLSDVPVGSFLSSGLDSSIIATIASRHLQELSTFTIGFEDLDDPYHGKANESHHAEAYAKKLGTRHHTIHVTGKDFLQGLDDFSLFGDQPWGVSSGLGVFAISKAARAAGIKVLLTGDGADECFGGYSWYTKLQGKKTINPSHQHAFDLHYYANEDDKHALFNSDAFANIQSSLRFFGDYKADKDWEPKDFITHDKLFYQPNEMLKKADRMTMANSVEGRAPFVAPGILNLAEQLPFELLIKNDQLKWVLRQAFQDLLPDDIVNRPKHGFNVPIDHWLKHEWAHLVEETFSPSSSLSRMGLLAPDALTTAKRLLEDKRLLGHGIFCYVMLNRWLQMHHL